MLVKVQFCYQAKIHISSICDKGERSKKVQVGKDQEKAQSEKDSQIQTDCKQSLRIGKIRALNGCTGRLFRAATRHNHKNSDIKRYK